MLFYRFLGSPKGSEKPVPEFSDSGSVSDYAHEAAQWAVANGILSGYGDGTIRPLNKVSRAELAAISVRFKDKFVQA